jgi:hypothetical protein
MGEGKHTPTPWRNQGWVPTWAYIPIHDASHNLVASMYPDSGHKYTREQVEANAAFIVLAVNSHDALVALANAIGASSVDVSGNALILADAGSAAVIRASARALVAASERAGKP